MMSPARDSIRDRVRNVYGDVAQAPDAGHPFKVGRELAVLAGYPPARPEPEKLQSVRRSRAGPGAALPRLRGL